MKKILFALVAAVAVLTSCSDKVYTELNTDPTKSLSANAASQLTFAELETYGHMGVVDMYRLYVYAFTQHLMGCWNTTNYGGQHRSDDNEMTRFWYNLYPNAIANLVDACHATKDDPNQVNIHAALRIYKVYMFSLLTDIYGDIPYKQAGLGRLEGISNPRYDTQKEIYEDFFKELKAAEAEFNPAGYSISSDVIYNGDIDMWKRFSASLRLRLAMRISDIDSDWAKAEAEDAVLSCFTDASQQALVKHAVVSFSFSDEAQSDFRGNAMSKYFYGNDPQNNPTYICSTFWKQLKSNNDPRTNLYCRFYVDDWMSVTSPEGRVDITDAVMTDDANGKANAKISLVLPGEFSWDNWPNYDKDATSAVTGRIEEILVAHPDWEPNKNPRWLKPKLATNFLKSDNPGVIMTYAEICFLRAEGALLGWNMGGSAEDFYKEGIRAAMDFVTDNYGYRPISDADYQTYLAGANVAWDAAAGKKLINTQAWILHFNNPAEAWANLRRSGYPELSSPATYQDKNPMIDGNEIPVRLLYPVKEESYNNSGYLDVMSRFTRYDWHQRLWWDVN